MKKGIYTVLAAMALIAVLAFSVSAESAVQSNDFSVAKLIDGKRSTYQSAQGSISLENTKGIAHLYIEFDRLPEDWALIAGGKEYPCEGGYLHQYIDVAALCGNFEALDSHGGISGQILPEEPKVAHVVDRFHAARVACGQRRARGHVAVVALDALAVGLYARHFVHGVAVALDHGASVICKRQRKVVLIGHARGVELP